MHLSQLEVREFRNYERQSLELTAGVVVFHGPNGSGKTSLLEAICVAALGDSPRARVTEELVRLGSEHAFLRGSFVGGQGANILEIGLARTGARQIKINGAVKKRLDLVGLAPVILFWAEDIETVRGDPSGRRRLLDRELGGISRPYAYHLARYRRAVEQRNRLLKLVRERKAKREALDPWDRATARHGAQVMIGRSDLISALSPEVTRAYEELTGGQVSLILTYRPSVDMEARQSRQETEKDQAVLEEKTTNLLLSSLEKQRENDIVYGTTGIGPHRDDLELALNGRPVRAFGSQGEQRSCAVAIRIGLQRVVRQRTGEKPLLLLDDVLSELDERHRKGVFAACAESEQVIVTCCDREDIPKEVREGGQVFEIVEGKVV